MATIAFFSAFSTPHVGGIETYTHRIAKELVRRGHRVIIVSANWNDGPDKEIVDGIEEMRLPCIKHPAGKRYSIIKPGRLYRQAKTWLRAQGITHVILNARFHSWAVMGANLGNELGVPVYLIEHGSDPLSLDSRVLDLGLNAVEHVFTRIVRPKITGAIGASEAAGEHLRERFGIEPISVWPNSIDVEDDGYRCAAIHDGPVVISFVGRIIAQKGVPELLEAFGRLRAKLGATVELRVAGDGALLDSIRQSHANEPGVKILGPISQPEVQQLLRETDIFAFPTRFPESLPSAILEAAVARCAIAATPAGGIVELVRDRETGLIIEPGVEPLVAALTELVGAPDARQTLAEAAREMALAKFSTASVVDKMLRDIGVDAGPAAGAEQAETETPFSR
jgi:glycosyltransferase involved in cell wall biosynthesis